VIAPTSVVGNWRKESKICPHLRAIVHHGSERAKYRRVSSNGRTEQRGHYLLHSDSEDLKLIESVDWHRVVLDEAQNIKTQRQSRPKPFCCPPSAGAHLGPLSKIDCWISGQFSTF